MVVGSKVIVRKPVSEICYNGTVTWRLETREAVITMDYMISIGDTRKVYQIKYENGTVEPVFNYQLEEV